MTDEQKSNLSHLLEQEEARIRQELSAVAVRDPATPDGYMPKSPDYGGEITEEDTARKTVDSETNIVMERELKNTLDNALKAREKLNNGTYGTCETCGSEIPIERLEALPMTPFCIQCAD